MADDEGFARYFSYLNLFTAAMLTLVLAANLVVMFIGWEGVGLCSYLLIAFWFTRPAAAAAGVKAFLVTRLGDVGFLLGIFLAFGIFGTSDFGILTRSAIARLPLGTVSAIEFLPVIVLAAMGVRSRRNGLALVLAVAGVYVLIAVQLGGEPLGAAFAFANAGLFALYIVLAHRVSRVPRFSGIDGLAGAMLIAAPVSTVIGGWAVVPHLVDPVAIAAGIGVGITSSVIPYVCDQLAMTRLSRATYSLMVSLLPATATVIGIVVLAQIPSPRQVLGVVLVVVAVALHRDRGESAGLPAREPGSTTDDRGGAAFSERRERYAHDGEDRPRATPEQAGRCGGRHIQEVFRGSVDKPRSDDRVLGDLLDLPVVPGSRHLPGVVLVRFGQGVGARPRREDAPAPRSVERQRADR